uniref:Reverse transcriptase RNase H-like domain-containing protein n=1 Tax=Ananas comosus var. bracteatus TaxID=296719 RepID=A0A6V7Q6B3_ANACO|nr:unnamed protein product [Ananas comosus var. bracteatus]
METRAQEQKKMEEMLRQLVKESTTRQDQAIQELRERQHMDIEELGGVHISLSARFGSDLFDDPMAELKGLRQIGSVLEYQDKFDALLNRVELSEEYAVNCFISGLKDEIQVPIRMFQPRTLQRALSLAKLQEVAIEGHTQLEYLGHIISQEGVAMDKQKVEAILKWPQLVSVKELRGFLGLARYYRRFVKNLGKISKPLHEMLGKGGFKWTEASLQALRQLKVAVATAPVLALPDFSAEFIVETDASGVGVGAVLLQKGRPIAFMSKPLSPRNQQLSTYEREMLAIVIAIQKWQPYLIGRHFKVKTDHQSLKYLLEQRVSMPSHQKWISKLMGYDYELVYKNGRENVVADALSRAPSLQAISAIHTNLREQIKLSWNQDERIKKILAYKQRGGHSWSHYTWTQGLLRRKAKLVATAKSNGLVTTLQLLEWIATVHSLLPLNSL